MKCLPVLWNQSACLFCDPSLPLINCVWLLDSFLICKLGRFKTFMRKSVKRKKVLCKGNIPTSYILSTVFPMETPGPIFQRTHEEDWGNAHLSVPCQGFHVQVSLYWTLSFILLYPPKFCDICTVIPSNG